MRPVFAVAVLSTLFAIPACSKKPAQSPESGEKVTRTSPDDNAEEPVKAPPPGYGNKVVADETAPDERSEDNAKHDGKSDDDACKDQPNETGDDESCVKAAAF